MRCLHLMPMNSSINVDLIHQINRHFPPEEHLFVLSVPRNDTTDIQNCIVAPDHFRVQYLNQNHARYDIIFLHSLNYSPAELLALQDDAAHKIIWCVWGHDLYSVHRKKQYTPRERIHEFWHFLKKLGRFTHLRVFLKQRKIVRKIRCFRCVLIGYPYDRMLLRKKYGKNLSIEIAPYFSSFDKADMAALLDQKNLSSHSGTNVLIGHCGFHFIEHQAYLQKLAAYRNENIHIHMVLSYGASAEEIRQIRETALRLFREDQITIIEEMMSKDDYHRYLSTMDVAIFPYTHQSGVFNTVLLSYLGTKMYFSSDGVLYKGFQEMGLPVFDCGAIGRIDYQDFCRPSEPPDRNAPLYDIYNNARNVERWYHIFQKYS